LRRRTPAGGALRRACLGSPSIGCRRPSAAVAKILSSPSVRRSGRAAMRWARRYEIGSTSNGFRRRRSPPGFTRHRQACQQIRPCARFQLAVEPITGSLTVGRVHALSSKPRAFRLLKSSAPISAQPVTRRCSARIGATGLSPVAWLRLSEARSKFSGLSFYFWVFTSWVSIATFASRSACALLARPTCSKVTRPTSCASSRAFACSGCSPAFFTL